jgi:serine/threonine-protein kinase
VVYACLEKERLRRYATVAELARALAPFGSQAARDSAESIWRIIEGGIARDEVAAERPSYGRATSARSRVDSEVVLPRSVRRPIAGYVLALGALFALAGIVGSAVVHRELDLRAARARMAIELGAPSVPAPPLPVVAPVTSLPSTTSALVNAPSASVVPPSTPTLVVAPAHREAPTPHVRAAPRHATIRMPRAPSLPTWATAKAIEPAPSAEHATSLAEMEPAIAPLVPAPAPAREAPAAASSAAPAASVDDLSDGRK